MRWVPSPQTQPADRAGRVASTSGPRPVPPRWWRATGALTATAVLLTVVGCGAGGGTDAAAPISPAGAVADAWQESLAGPVTLRTPAGWERVRTTPDGADEAYLLVSRTTDAKVQVVLWRERSIDDLVGWLEDDLRDNGGTDLQRAQVDWPRADAAQLVTYVAVPPGETTGKTYEHLVLQRDDGALVLASVVASSDAFEVSRAHDVLSSVELTG